MKKLTLLVLTMQGQCSLFSLFRKQSYGDFSLIPNNLAKSSLTCMDKRPIFGQIENNSKKVVQRR